MTKPAPPLAAVKPHKTSIHGVDRVDNYYWLNEKKNPQVIAYLEAENAHTQAMTQHTKGLEARLFKEFKSRLKETDLSVPTPKDKYYYYSRTFEGKQYPVYCRKQGSLEAPEEVLLDANELAAGHDYFRLGVFEVSPDHKLLAYAVDTNGSETYTLRIKDLTTGQLRPDIIPNVYYSCEWGNDNETLFYSTLDAAKRPFKIWRHILGADPAKDEVVHHETDERFFARLSKTRSEKYILINLGSAVTDEVRFLDADKPAGRFITLHPRQQDMEYKVAHHGDTFYIVTNDQAVNFKLMSAPVESPSKGNWKEVIPHRSDVKLDRIDSFQDHLVLYERKDGLRQIRIRSLKSDDDHYITFPEPVYTTFAGDNREFNTDTLRFQYMSLVTPRSVFDYNMNTKKRELKKQDEVRGGYDPSKYTSQRIWATASDGTRVPISLVYKKGLTRNGQNPLLLYGYGSYEASMDPTFSLTRVSLLDRGVIYAIAHIRGGGEMGRMWYENGKYLHKKNTFTDFIACAEHLIAFHYTNPDKIAIQGGSAGGLLMGAVTNMRPDLFHAVVAQVPFVDVVTTMLDTAIPLTVIEYEEWGNPNVKKYFDYMLTYSPVDNVGAKDYPNMLITAGLNDPRVGYFEPAKWCAKLRALKTDHNTLLLKTNMGAGHGGKSGRYRRLEEAAFTYAFVLDQLGIKR
ncbi:MAG: S9 family peptidase [Phycisphaerae bacterium]